MVQTVKLESQDLQRLLDVDQRWKAVVQELGQISLAELNLKQKKESVERFLEQTKDLEQKAARLLEEKYGKGSVDITTGEFTPLPE